MIRAFFRDVNTIQEALGKQGGELLQDHPQMVITLKVYL